MSDLSDEYSKNFSSEKRAEFNRRFRDDYDAAMSERSNILRILAEMRELGLAEGGRINFDNGGIIGLRSDPAVAKKLNEVLKNKAINDAIKLAPEGVLMDPPPRPNYELIEEILNPKDKGLMPTDNYVEYDDGTVFLKHEGKFYKQDGTQVKGPSKGAKIKPKIMEAAEGGLARMLGE
tara:strand:- start:910 stop:1443 length:534 start_codon:yes stop_codon:yes gene_type:complete